MHCFFACEINSIFLHLFVIFFWLVSFWIIKHLTFNSRLFSLVVVFAYIYVKRQTRKSHFVIIYLTLNNCVAQWSDICTLYFSYSAYTVHGSLMVRPHWGEKKGNFVSQQLINWLICKSSYVIDKIIIKFPFWNWYIFRVW